MSFPVDANSTTAGRTPRRPRMFNGSRCLAVMIVLMGVGCSGTDRDNVSVRISEHEKKDLDKLEQAMLTFTKDSKNLKRITNATGKVTSPRRIARSS